MSLTATISRPSFRKFRAEKTPPMCVRAWDGTVVSEGKHLERIRKTAFVLGGRQS